MDDVREGIDTARAVLSIVEPRPGPMGLLGATALAATAAVLLAGVMVLGPGVAIEPPVASSPAS